MAVLSDKGVSFMAGFFMLIAFAIGGMLIGGMLSIPVIMAMTGKTAISVTEVMGNPAFFREMQIMQTISAIFGFLVPTIFTAYILSKRPLALTGFTGKISSKQLLLTILIIACGLALSASLGYLSYQIPFSSEWKKIFLEMESDYAKMAVNLINLDSPFELFISIIVLALIPAIAEEAIFRGGLQNYMYRATKKFWLSVIVVSLLFSAVHFSVYGFSSRFVLGIILGLLFQYSGKLWLPILAHFINNAAAVIMLYVQKSNGKSIADVMSDKDGSYIGLLTLPVIIYLFMKFRQASSKPAHAEFVQQPAIPDFSFTNKTNDGV